MREACDTWEGGIGIGGRVGEMTVDRKIVEVVIIMAGMSLFLRGWIPRRGKEQIWPVITASPRGQCSK